MFEKYGYWHKRFEGDPSVLRLPTLKLAPIARREWGLTDSNFQIPHLLGWALSRDAAERHGDELDYLPNLPKTDWILILPERLRDGDAGSPSAMLLASYVHLLMDRAWGAASDGDPIRKRTREYWDALDPTTRAEIVQVLGEESRLNPDPDTNVILREWLATLIELRWGDPAAIDEWFPGLARHNTAMVEEMSDLAATSLVVDRNAIPERRPRDIEALAPTPDLSHDATPLPPRHERTLPENDVRLLIKALREGQPVEAEVHLHVLAERVARTWGQGVADAADWYRDLEPALPELTGERWNQTHRLFYDLQTACLELERVTYAVDLVEWAVSRGKHKIRRPLELPDDVRILKRLRSARARLADADIDPGAVESLSHHLLAAETLTSRRLAGLLRPRLEEAFEEVGLVPHTRVEEIAAAKIIDELIDNVQERGFLRMSDLRDALARNDLKLGDVSGVKDWWSGDKLLRLNRLLPYKLDGIYRRGEVYLRALQRGSSLFFGTALGRFLTLFLILPFGGAFVAMEGLHHLIEAGEKGWHWLHDTPVPPPEYDEDEEVEPGSPPPILSKSSILTRWETIFGVGVLFELLIHWPAFRRQAGSWAYYLLWEIPRRILHSRAVRFLWANPLVRLLRLRLLVPILAGVVMGFFAAKLGWHKPETYYFAVGGVLTSLLFLQTPLGRDLQDSFNDWLETLWYRVSVNLVVGTLTLILDVFRWLIDHVERVLYSVDEWLRFRQGESKVLMWVKMLLGVGWFVIAYVVRFAINLLIEPQINPIKHFPVVTVSHKLLLPLIPSISATSGLNIEATTLIVSGIPGIFGFLVWELKANWRLYRSNRPRSLAVESVGGHGETVRGLLRPGFHSGAVPKLYRKMRRNRQYEGAAFVLAKRQRTAQKMHHHVAGLEHLVERWFLEFLGRSKRWSGLPLTCLQVHPTVNRLEIALGRGGEDCLTIRLDQREGWMVAGVEPRTAWTTLTADEHAALHDAVAGFYKACGIGLVWEQWGKVCGVDERQLDVVDPETVADGVSHKRWTIGPAAIHEHRPTASPHDPWWHREQLELARVGIGWAAWEARWEADLRGEPLPPLPTDDWQLLPPLPPDAARD